MNALCECLGSGTMKSVILITLAFIIIVNTSEKPTPAARKEFEKRVLANPKATPKQLVVGSTTDPMLSTSSVRHIHQAYGHLDRTADQKRVVLRKHGLKTRNADDWFWELTKAQAE